MPRKRNRADEPIDQTPPEAAPGPIEAKGGAPEYTELVLLVHAANLAEAELFKAELETNGIPAILEGEGAGVAGVPDVGAGVPVLVPEEYADQAAELIAELESPKPEDAALDKDGVFDEGEEEEEKIEDPEENEVEDLDELDEDDEDLDEEWEDEEEDDEDWDDDEDDDEDVDDDR